MSTPVASALVAVLIALAGCGEESREKKAVPAPARGGHEAVGPGAAGLRDAFNAAAGRPRVLMLVAPS